jgi:hypothetical protein
MRRCSGAVRRTGPEMSDLSIFPPFFFFVGVDFSFSFSFLSSLTLTVRNQRQSHHPSTCWSIPPPLLRWKKNE